MSLKTKSLLRDFCKYVYYAGVGNCWCEDIYKETIFYKAYSVITFSIYTTMIFLENLAALLGNFPDVEKNSAFMFSAIHNIVLAKMYLLLYHKISVRKLNHEMATVGENFEERFVMKKQYRKAKVGILLYIISVYLSLTAYGVESVRKVVVEGAPFYTVVTYYPYYDDHSSIASFLRVFFYVTWLYMMLPMMSADCLPITHLITMTYKFVTLRRYFENLRDDFDSDYIIDKKKAYEKLKAGFLEGIRIHQKLLFLTEEINRVFGIIMSLQVCESSAVAVLLLLRLAVSGQIRRNIQTADFAKPLFLQNEIVDFYTVEMNAWNLCVECILSYSKLSPHLDLTNAFMTYTFVGSLFLLLALNLWNAGEITFQASLLSNAMFSSGWHMCELEKKSHCDIRRLVLIGCAQAQKPLILKAFGIQDLSYETFVSVARMTYSVFAVFYQRGNDE